MQNEGDSVQEQLLWKIFFHIFLHLLSSPSFIAISSPSSLGHSKLLARTDSSCRMATHWLQDGGLPQSSRAVGDRRVKNGAPSTQLPQSQLWYNTAGRPKACWPLGPPSVGAPVVSGILCCCLICRVRTPSHCTQDFPHCFIPPKLCLCALRKCQGELDNLN